MRSSATSPISSISLLISEESTFTPVFVSSSWSVPTNDINTTVVTTASIIAAITAARQEITVIFVPILIDLFTFDDTFLSTHHISVNSWNCTIYISICIIDRV